MFPYQLNHQYSLLTSSSSTTNNWNQSNLQSNSQNSLMSGNANMNFQFPVAQNPLQMILVNNPPMWNQFRQFLQQQNINIASQTDNSFAKTFWNLQQAKLAEGQNSISRFIEHPQPPSFGSSSQNEQCFYFADRKFYDIQTYLEFVEEYEAVKSDLRSLPNYSDLNYLNVPPESSMEQYQLLHGFKFAIPQKIRQFEKAQYMTSSNYDEIKIELENNGTDADWTVEERTLKGDMMTLMDSPKFPPSQLPLTSNLSLIWEMSSDVNPMQLANYNSVASYSPNSTKSSQESLKKNTPKRSKKPLEDVTNTMPELFQF